MKILLADDHLLFRDALTKFIYALRPQWEISTASTLEETYLTIKQHDKGHFDLLLLDMRMRGMNGLHGLKCLLNDFPSLKTTILSSITRESQVRAAMQMGATAYFPKTLPSKLLVTAIHLAANGENFIPVDESGLNIMPSLYSKATTAQDNVIDDTQKTNIDEMDTLEA